MDRQSVYDRVKAHLLAQGEKAQTMHEKYGKICAYRGMSGKKCAIGALIPDEMYVEAMEGNAPTAEPLRPLRAHLGVEGNDEKFLIALQEVHDCSPPHEWSTKLEALAVEYGLRL